MLFKHEYQDIEQTLFSLFAEESISKVVIVDNGAFCEWLTSFRHEKLDIIRLPVNKGFGAGHNAVFELYANMAPFILICNPDITFAKGEVDKLYNFSYENEVGLAIPKIVYPDGRLQHGTKLLPSPYQLLMRRFMSRFSYTINDSYELRRADYNKPFFAPSLSGCFMLISSKVLQDVKGFDTRFFMYLEDVDLSRRVCQSAFSVSYFPGSLVIHESQRRSYNDVRFLLYHITSTIRYFNKWGWFYDRQRVQLNKRCLANLPLSERQ
ncbi:dTDP-Rha:alpha-D-GlcNAc-pyrophosphate polyprenol%2C alpha-3-L-rhamnosyltransferase [Yersinia frederiksenii]|nr:dTDP-Rha:alpha-D-GlcNAc-pyrophosphate polyprenol%2C alpha-3-L-rhamnosyltransferase [Yersinia frederiksenii]CNL26639.1 dTDP-Rha:alpha-D-GlcNAc-pyrophosphate polyprenol%2C alpha-3-L-rhamnosyltransferase [Yersinia frederiksenii]